MKKNSRSLRLYAVKAGQILASVSTTDNEFDLAERERIRQALLAYMKEHKIGVPTLAARIKASHPREMEIPWKTLQRFLAGTRTHDMALTICKAFAENLPNKPTAMHALGEALHAVYGKAPDILAGTYAISAHETVISRLTLIPQRVANIEDQKFLLATEVTTGSLLRIYDGVVVLTGSSILGILKDRLMHTARVHGLHLRSAPSESFHGIVYDNGPLERCGIPYQTFPVSVTRAADGPV